MWAVLGDPDHGEALENLTPMDMADYFEDDVRRIAEILRDKTADQWEVEFNRGRVPAAKVRELDQALADPQLDGRAVLQSASVDDQPAFRDLPVAAFQYAENGPRLRFPPPLPAQHTGEVLREIGYDDAQLLRLEKQGVIKLAPSNGKRP